MQEFATENRQAECLPHPAARFRQGLPMKRTPSVLVRVLMSNAALGSLTVVVLVILLMAAVRQSFRAQLDLRAAEMAEFLAAQSQYPLLVADRAALGQLVASALH